MFSKTKHFISGNNFKFNRIKSNTSTLVEEIMT